MQAGERGKSDTRGKAKGKNQELYKIYKIRIEKRILIVLEIERNKENSER